MSWIRWSCNGWSLPTKVREGNVFTRACHCGRGGGGGRLSHVTITHDALDLTIQGILALPSPDMDLIEQGSPPRHRTSLPHPTWDLTAQGPPPPQCWHQVATTASGRYASYWKFFLLDICVGYLYIITKCLQSWICCRTIISLFR